LNYRWPFTECTHGEAGSSGTLTLPWICSLATLVLPRSLLKMSFGVSIGDLDIPLRNKAHNSPIVNKSINLSRSDKLFGSSLDPNSTASNVTGNDMPPVPDEEQNLQSVRLGRELRAQM